ncbi:MAG: lysophospholipid acyltransferase family protein [Bacteroidales bacterium]|nr:lysophospholipid acyltransferase family protein [Bacteroidales bacterium]
MGVISEDDLMRLVKPLHYLGGKTTAKAILRILGLQRCNEIYDSTSHLNGSEALDALIAQLGLTYSLSESDLTRLPKEGAFIVVSNHPFGAAEGLIITQAISSVRPDVKVIVNFMLERVQNISNFWFSVNPFETKRDLFNSGPNLKSVYKYLKEGHPVVIFPAGEVSTRQKNGFISDRSWNQPVMKLIKKAQLPIIPIYFDGRNSTLFEIAGKIHPMLRTILIPRQLINKRRQVIKMRIGNPISVKEQDRYEDLETYSRVLRLYCYALQLSFRRLEKAPIRMKFEYPEPLAAPAPELRILSEIEMLRKNPDTSLISSQNYTAFCAHPQDIPNIMYEIARQREITFREVGEGTNNAFDKDEYDDYFYQLFIWDNLANRLVGSYRIGVGAEIYKEQNKLKGFYISTLFDIDEKLKPIFCQCLELGRSFIVKDYQKKMSPLFILWKGLLVMMHKKNARYLIGAVSISGQFSALSKALTIDFLKSNFFDYDIARYIKNKEKTRFKLIRAFDRETFKLVTRSDFNCLDAFIKSIDPEFSTPVLVKQYVSLVNAEAIGFNVDPLFNNCLDALMYMDFQKTPKETLAGMIKDMDNRNEMAEFFDIDPKLFIKKKETK